MDFQFSGLVFTENRKPIGQHLQNQLGQRRKTTRELVKRAIIPLLLTVGQIVCIIATVGLGLFSETVVAEQKYVLEMDKSIVYQPMYRFCSLKPISDSSFGILIAALVMDLVLFLQLIYDSYQNEMVRCNFRHDFKHFF